jgi:hypothetical protein
VPTPSHPAIINTATKYANAEIKTLFILTLFLLLDLHPIKKYPAKIPNWRRAYNNFDKLLALMHDSLYMGRSGSGLLKEAAICTGRIGGREQKEVLVLDGVHSLGGSTTDVTKKSNRSIPYFP